MDYITAEQILEQPMEVQKVLKEWWYGNNPSRFDVVSFHDGDYRYNCILQDLTKYPNNFCVLDNLESGGLIPCFDEGKLRKFIEEKLNEIFIIKHIVGEKLKYVFEFGMNTIFELGTCAVYADNLLQAYWQVACEIAKEGA